MTSARFLKSALIAFLACAFVAAGSEDLEAQSLEQRTALDTAHLGGLLVGVRWVYFGADESYLLFREPTALIAATLGLDGTVGDRFEVLDAPRGATIFAYDVVKSDDGLIVYLVSRRNRTTIEVSSYRLSRHLETIGSPEHLGQMRARATRAQIRVGSHEDSTAVVIATHNVPRTSDADRRLGSLFFLVTDARGRRGSPIHDLTPVREPNISSDIRVEKPHWSGTRWLVPVAHTLVYAYPYPPRPKVLITFDFDAEMEVVGVRDAGSKTPDVGRRVLFRPEVFNPADTYQMFFISEGVGGGAGSANERGGQFRLLLQQTKSSDYSASYDALETEYRIITVDAEGEQAGGVRRPRIPRFKHGIPYQADTYVASFLETVTPVRLPGGRMVLLMTRSLNVAQANTNEFIDGIQRLRVFAYNDRSARVVRRSVTTIDKEPGVETAKQVNVIEGRIHALAGRFITEETGDTTVFKTIFFLERFSR